MPSLTATLLYKVELTPEELRLILSALEGKDGPTSAYTDLADKLRKQRDAFVKHMLQQVDKESPPE